MTRQPYNRGYTRGTSRRNRQRRRAQGFLLFVVSLALAVLLLRSQVFVLKQMTVTGNARYSADEIMAFAGLSYGDSIFSLDAQQVERNLSGEISVEYIAFSKELPDKAALQIREREALACVNCGGEYLLIDETGYIMNRSDSYPGGGLLSVSGLEAYVDRQGKRIESAVVGRRRVMEQIINALREKGLLQQISELNVSDLDRLYLVSGSGVQVILGDEHGLPEKLEWMRAVLAQLTQQGVMSGVLDVSTGKNAVYADR